jgi:methyltransferase (TIGR00027 family)
LPPANGGCKNWRRDEATAQKEETLPNPASQTAFGPMLVVAIEQYYSEEQRLVQDDLAYRFLPAYLKFIARLARWLPARKLLLSLSEKAGPGIWGSQLCRKRYIDDKIHETAGEIAAVVILGAGLDTRAYRMPDLVNVSVFEADLPENSAYKQAKLHDLYRQVPSTVRLVSIDFERQDLETVLAEHGYHGDRRTFFVWEGVTQYLTEGTVRKTSDFLAKAASGSRLVFTYVRQDFMEGVNLFGASRLYQQYRIKQQLWHFGMMPE